MKQENQLITPTIQQIQEAFLKSVFNKQDVAIWEQFCQSEIAPEFRFSVYRNTILQNLRNSLEVTFPSTWKLVGKVCADSLALAFVQDHSNLPTTNCLDDWGEKFPAFLQNNEAVKHLLYLKDIAEIEWLRHLSYCSQDYLALDSRILQKHLNNSVGKLCLIFNPSVFLYSSPYYLKNIFELIENPVEIDFINFQHLPSYVVIVRQKNQVLTHWITKDMFTFLSYLKDKVTLEQSYENTLENNPNFDLFSGLQFLLKNELLEYCSIYPLPQSHGLDCS